MRIAVFAFVLFGWSISAAQTTSPNDIGEYSSFGDVFYADSSIVTNHQIAIEGKKVSYKATTGTLPVRDAEGKTMAGVFSVYYERVGKDIESATRPLVFFFNGGYGSPAKWLHLGYAGPKILNLDDEGYPVQPFGVSDNLSTILDIADLVFVDPVGTGYSRPLSDYENQSVLFYNEFADVNYLGQFIGNFLDKYNRRISPVFFVGESAGGRRVARLASLFGKPGSTQPYINLAGIVLLSSASLIGNPNTIYTNRIAFPFKLISWLPFYTRYAHSTGLIKDKYLFNLDSLSIDKQVRKFAVDTLFGNLMRIGVIDQQKKRSLAKRMSDFTGVDTDAILNQQLFIDTTFFASYFNIPKSVQLYSGNENNIKRYCQAWDASSNFVTEVLTTQFYLEGLEKLNFQKVKARADSAEYFFLNSYLPALLSLKDTGFEISNIKIRDEVQKLIGSYPERQFQHEVFRKLVDINLKKIGFDGLDHYDIRYNANSGFFRPRQLAMDPALLHYFQTALNYKTKLNYDYGPWDETNVIYSQKYDPLHALNAVMSNNPFVKVLFQAGYYDRAVNILTQKVNMWQLDPTGKMQNRIGFKTYAGGHMMYFRKSERIKACEDLRYFILSCLPKSGKTLDYKDLKLKGI
ncbi:MAG: S10 family serine carboxypeptidase-like protein [Sediminibacterium sp.]